MSRKRSLITSLHESTTSKYFKPDGAVQPVSSALIAFVYVTADMEHCLMQAAKRAAESDAQMINFVFSPNVIANRHHEELLNCLESCLLPVTGRKQFLSSAHGCYVSCWLSSFASGAQHECLENSESFPSVLCLMDSCIGKDSVFTLVRSIHLCFHFLCHWKPIFKRYDSTKLKLLV